MIIVPDRILRAWVDEFGPPRHVNCTDMYTPFRLLEQLHPRGVYKCSHRTAIIANFLGGTNNVNLAAVEHSKSVPFNRTSYVEGFFFFCPTCTHPFENCWCV